MVDGDNSKDWRDLSVFLERKKHERREAPESEREMKAHLLMTVVE